MNTAVMQIDSQLLIEILHLPKDTKIIGAEINWHYGSQVTVDLRVMHPDIPEGVQNVNPIFLREFHPIEKVIFQGWG